MSKNRNRNQIAEEVVENMETIETKEAIEGEIVEEQTEEKKPNKWLQRAKKIAPFAIIGGAIAVAFAFGRSTGSDAGYLEALQAENETKDPDIDSTGSTDEASEDTED